MEYKKQNKRGIDEYKTTVMRAQMGLTVQSIGSFSAHTHKHTHGTD